MFKVQIPLPSRNVYVHSPCEGILPKMIAAFQADYISATKAAIVCLRLRMGKQQRQNKNFEGQRYNLKATIRLGKKRKDNFSTFINEYTGRRV